jgi:hypothetical protein
MGVKDDPPADLSATVESPEVELTRYRLEMKALRRAFDILSLSYDRLRTDIADIEGELRIPALSKQVTELKKYWADRLQAVLKKHQG